jgi:glycerate kinase
MADGGEGTVEALVNATGGRILFHDVQSPILHTVSAKYGILGDGETAVIEMAEASGLCLIPPEHRNPLRTTSYGTGELIKAALDQGCRKFIIGIGGSGTNDGGAGMAQALGARLLDKDGRSLSPGGGALIDLAHIDVSALDPRLKDCQFTVACDVDNPLCGPQGASYVFGPQKGATPDMVAHLDESLAHYARVIERDLGKSVAEIPGAGAAGGLGAGLVAFLDATLKRGVEMVIEACGIEEKIRACDLVLTGEGRCDGQTERGKVPFGIAKTAQRLGVPVIVMAGSIGIGAESLYQCGVQSIFSIVDGPMTEDDAKANAFELLASATERVMRLLRCGASLQGRV